MAPFKFRLEQVRLYRKQLEEQAMQAMAQAVMQRDELQRRIDVLEQELTELRTSLSRADAMASAERWLASSYETALKHDLRAAHQALSEAELLVDQRRTELVQKAKERGLLDSLKEKQAARHLTLERQQEQRTNDETATLRFKSATI